MDQTFNIRFDARTKEVITQALYEAQAKAASAVLAGDYSEEALTRVEELSQVIRGVLYSRPVVTEEPKEAKEDALDRVLD